MQVLFIAVGSAVYRGLRPNPRKFGLNFKTMGYGVRLLNQ
jgi:hypothetical protein